MNDRIVNLRRVRKQKAREEKRAAGAAAALTHGLSKAERDLTDNLRSLDAHRLDGHKLEKKPDESDE